MTTCTKPFKTRGFRDLAKVDLVHSTHALERRGLFDIVEMNMERAVAIKKLGKILGKSLGYRVDPKAPDQEGRDEARAKLAEANPKRAALEQQLNARRIAVLQADAEYQQLKAAHAEARKYCSDLQSTAFRYRFTVGTTGSLFFSVMAQGDSWEDVIDQLTKKKAA